MYTILFDRSVMKSKVIQNFVSFFFQTNMCYCQNIAYPAKSWLLQVRTYLKASLNSAIFHAYIAGLIKEEQVYKVTTDPRAER